ncbi:MAG: thiamine-monophosphate kinase [Myxococcota bacterium]
MSFNEDQLHRLFAEKFQSRADLFGPGDDCAILMSPPSPFCISCDQLIAGVHFDEHASSKQIAEKLIGRSLSDLAAAGATPYSCTITCAFPVDFSEEQSAELCEQLLQAAAEYDMPIIGGDCSQAQQLVLTCTVMGHAEAAVPGRRNAQVGSQILVSRALGGSLLSQRHLSPQPELKLGSYLAQRYSPQAMIDLSDGLDNDLKRILTASKVGAIIHTESIPLNEECDWQQAVCDGEDYGLLVVIATEKLSAIRQDDFFVEHPLFHIGEIINGDALIYQRQQQVVELQRLPFSY